MCVYVKIMQDFSDEHTHRREQTEKENYDQTSGVRKCMQREKQNVGCERRKTMFDMMMRMTNGMSEH